MKTYQVIRTHLSPYQAADFTAREKALIQSIDGLEYRELAQAQADQDTILITNTHSKLSELPAALLQKTRLIIHPNSGYDNFATEQELWEDLPLVVGHSIRASGVAEYVLACIFQGLTELPQHLSWDAKRIWNRHLISESEIWIFGHGHIGSVVAETLKNLGAKIVVVDPFIHDCPHPLLKKWEEGNIKQADIIIACCGLNKSSQGIFNKKFFDHLNPSAIFINGARGKLVVTKDLQAFLLAHPDAQAFLDVFENEPFSEEWHHFPQTWKTSHIAGVSKNLDDKILAFEQEVLTDYLKLNSHFFSMKYYRELLQNKFIEGVLI
jgi:D-3-phosphoglycerate dehydrogenase / 2-oxoglutarate reductase